MHIINPTGYSIRIADKWGYGHYLAPRGDRLHFAEDFYCNPGQDIVSPIAGEILREITVYTGSHLKGLIISNQDMELKLLYISVTKNIIGQWVKQGEIIGKAQDIRDKYTDITPHVHMEIVHIRPSLLI